MRLLKRTLSGLVGPHGLFSGYQNNFLRFLSINTNRTSSRLQHDYIIVGAGSSGCVLANRLSSDNSNTVALIEAGPEDKSDNIRIPEHFSRLMFHDKFNWNYNTKAQKYLNNRQLYYPRGKVLGGSSSINVMAYVRGHPFDFDRWQKQGAQDWSFEHVLPYFKRSQCHELGKNLYRGGSGLLKVSRSKWPNVLYDTFFKAGAQAGYGFTEDYNGFQQEGFGETEYTIYNGERVSTATAFLKPAMKNKNLTVITESLVTKIIFNGKRAVGVEILNKHGYLQKMMANKEVILSGGTINSPQLLMLSGVGDGDELKQHSIDVVQHIPGVGRNLQDHSCMVIQHKCTKPVAKYSQLNQIKGEGTNYESKFVQSPHFNALAFFRSGASIPHPDIQLFFATHLFLDHGQTPDPYDGFLVLIVLLRPKSRGRLSLQNLDPRSHPIIDLNLCSNGEDVETLRKGTRLTREIMAQSAFDEYRGEELFPGPNVQSDAQVDEMIAAGCTHMYHATSTCKMGSTNDNEVVVDSQCRVVGLDGIRVVDASIMPSLVSGNTNAATIMIAEKASDMILGLPCLLKEEAVPVWTPKFPSQQRDSA